jgi:carbamoyl-phosphate synthase small subunit
MRNPLPPTVAEVVFTTNMTGYQEVFTDPSYQGQIVTLTAPMIGNYGVNTDDPESAHVQVAGVIVREMSEQHSNWRATGGLREWLAQAKVPLLEDIDTRRLTRHLRSAGVMRGVIGAGESPDAAAVAALEACPSMEGLDLASRVTTSQHYVWGNPAAAAHIVAYDYGIKRNILRVFAEHDCRVTVVPADTSAEEALSLAPDGVFLSNGPGDPAATGEYAVPTIQALMDKAIPIFGICLGHQMLGLAAGAKTAKMHQGHRGANHPVKRLADGVVEITSMNHGFAVDNATLPDGVEETHVSLFDGSNCGIAIRGKKAFGVQYHPEASPGPHDSYYLFEKFVGMLK